MEAIKKDELNSFLNNYFDGIEPWEVINIRKIKYSVENVATTLDGVMNELTLDNIKYKNIYFNLSTFKDSTDYKTENVAYRYAIAFDWDLKDFLECTKEDLFKLYAEDRALFDKNKKLLLSDIYNRVNTVKGLYLHYIVDSGFGYHAYILINKTNDVEKVIAVQKELIKLLNSDKSCSDMVRVLRVPYTYNMKNGSVKTQIVLDNITNNDKFQRYDIDRLYNRFCVKKSKHNEVKTFDNADYSNNYICIQKALKEGSQQHHKNDDLVNIVVYLRNRNKTLEEIKEIVKDWDCKSNYNDMTEYRVNYIYNNQKGYDLNCEGCKYKLECNKVAISDFDFVKYDDDGELIPTIVIEDKYSKMCKTPKTKKFKTVGSKKKGDKVEDKKICINEISGNELLLINVLKNNFGQLTTSELMDRITFKRRHGKKVLNVAMSEPTLIKTLKLLNEKGIVETIKGNSRAGVENSHKLNYSKAKIENTIEVSYLANLAVIWGIITPSELKLYILMRYLHKEQQRESCNSLKGNLFQFTQNELAKSYYGSDTTTNKGNISKMIDGLIDSKLLEVWSINKDEKGREYYIYRLNA